MKYSHLVTADRLLRYDIFFYKFIQAEHIVLSPPDHLEILELQEKKENIDPTVDL